MYLVYMYI